MHSFAFYKHSTNVCTGMLCHHTMLTSNLSKVHVTLDSSGPATLAISVQHAIK